MARKETQASPASEILNLVRYVRTSAEASSGKVRDDTSTKGCLWHLMHVFHTTTCLQELLGQEHFGRGGSVGDGRPRFAFALNDPCCLGESIYEGACQTPHLLVLGPLSCRYVRRARVVFREEFSSVCSLARPTHID
jgi:hypothetical protein